MRVRTAILLLLIVLLLVSAAHIADGEKTKKRGRRSKKKKRKNKAMKGSKEKVKKTTTGAVDQQGDGAPAVKTSGSGAATNRKKAKGLKKSSPSAKTFTVSGTVLGLSNDPVKLPDRTKKAKKRAAKGHGAPDGASDVLPQIILAATPISKNADTNGIVEGKVNLQTGEFSFELPESGVEYDVALSSVPPSLPRWGFKLSPSSIRVVSGSSQSLSFLAIPSPPKGGHTLSGVVDVGDDTNLLEKVSISLYKQYGAEKKLLQRTTLKESHRPARYFSFGGLENGRYAVILSIHSTELDVVEVGVDSDNASSPSTHVKLSALSRRGSDHRFGQDELEKDDANIVGSFFSVLLASLMFAGVMFPKVSGLFFSPFFVALASSSESARSFMRSSNLAILKKAAAQSDASLNAVDEAMSSTTNAKKRRGKGQKNKIK